MKKVIVFAFVFILFFWTGCTTREQKIEYGANNGEYLTILDTKIYYEEYGRGTPLILLQGGLGSIKDFEKCIPELSNHYRVIAPDTPGQGRSELADSMSYDLLTEYISRFIDSLKIDSAYIMGWSDGGIVGLLLADKRPDKVKKVLAAGANYSLRGAAPPTISIDSLKPMPLDKWEIQNQDWIKNYVKILPRDWKKLKNDLDNMWYQKIYFSPGILERIKIPVMIALGDRDDIMLEHGIEMHRLIKNSQFCVLPNTSHAVFNDSPDLINKIALNFF